MSQPTLVVLAAGQGSRFGGLKQTVGFGPHGETLLDYSVFDARRAGFGKIVFVIRRDFADAFRDQVAARFMPHGPVELVFQDMDDLPSGFAVPPGRVKPWGTGHATLAARHAVAEPFGVINADDFYGRETFATLAGFLRQPGLDLADTRACLVAFTLRNTLSAHGKVARGVCETTPDGLLSSVVEMTDLHRAGSAAENRPPDGPVLTLTGDEPVSLNSWGFAPSIFPHLERLFGGFLATHGHELKPEFYLPVAVDQLIRDGRVRCRVLRSGATWFGVTFKEDTELVRSSLASLHAAGEYPPRLWG